MVQTAEIAAGFARLSEEIKSLREKELHQSFGFSVRWYGYSNNRWVSPNRLYGWANQNAATNGGVGAAPVSDHADKGIPLPAGAIIHSFTAEGYTDNAEYSDAEVSLRLIDLTGDVSGGGVAAQDVLAPTAFGWPTSNAQTNRMVQIDVGGVALATQGKLVIYIRPIGSIAGTTRYFYGTVMVHYTLPARA